jgi:hypothetical protein
METPDGILPCMEQRKRCQVRVADNFCSFLDASRSFKLSMYDWT